MLKLREHGQQGVTDPSGICSGRIRPGQALSWLQVLDPTQKQELVMENFGYSRCSQCNEEYVFQEGSRCARCLSLVYVPIDDEDNQQEGPSRSLLDLPAAA